MPPELKKVFLLVLGYPLRYLGGLCPSPFKRVREKHRRYIGFRYVIRVFLMVFFSTLTYLRLGTLGSFRVRVRVGVCRP